MSTPIFSVDELCRALEDVQAEHLAETMTLMGYTDQGEIRTWQQVPTVQALAAADLPAGAIVASGLVNPPAYRSASRTWETTWRITVGIYARGRDHDETQAHIRRWCAGTRTNVLRHKGLGGLAKSLTWAGEEYAFIPGRESARTIAAGACAFNVTADVTTDLGNPPRVVQTPTTLSVK
jgi:hypothetical protein